MTDTTNRDETGWATPWCYRTPNGAFVEHTTDTPCAGFGCAKSRLKSALHHGSQETIEAAWADYDAALVTWLDDQSHRGTIEADPEYDDLEARTRDALIGYNDDRIRR